MSLRETADGLQVLASAFGPLGGDRTRLEVLVEAGASLDVGSVASPVAQPGPRDVVSRAAIDLQVDADARLRWLPRPMVVTSGAEHRVDLRVRVAGGGRAVLVDTVVLGHVLPGRYRARWRVTHDEQPLLATDLDVGTGAPGGWDGPAVLGGGRVVVTGLVVGAGIPDDLGVAGADVLRLAGPGALLSWVGTDAVEAARVAADFVGACARNTSFTSPVPGGNAALS